MGKPIKRSQNWFDFINKLSNEPHFLFDTEKMNDFVYLEADEFLESYSYLTEEEYNNTLDLFMYLRDLVHAYDDKEKKYKKKKVKHANSYVAVYGGASASFLMSQTTLAAKEEEKRRS